MVVLDLPTARKFKVFIWKCRFWPSSVVRPEMSRRNTTLKSVCLQKAKFFMKLCVWS
jgi:hypothetical protein